MSFNDVLLIGKKESEGKWLYDIRINMYMIIKNI